MANKLLMACWSSEFIATWKPGPYLALHSKIEKAMDSEAAVLASTADPEDKVLFGELRAALPQLTALAKLGKVLHPGKTDGSDAARLPSLSELESAIQQVHEHCGKFVPRSMLLALVEFNTREALHDGNGFGNIAAVLTADISQSQNKICFGSLTETDLAQEQKEEAQALCLRSVFAASLAQPTRTKMEVRSMLEALLRELRKVQLYPKLQRMVANLCMLYTEDEGASAAAMQKAYQEVTDDGKLWKVMNSSWFGQHFSQEIRERVTTLWEDECHKGTVADMVARANSLPITDSVAWGDVRTMCRSCRICFIVLRGRSSNQ